MAKEAEVNGKKYGEESLITIKLNIKNMVILLGFIGSMITGGYYLLKGDIKEVKNEIEQIRDEDLKVIYGQLNQVDGKVQVLVNARNWTGSQPLERSIITPIETPDTISSLPDLNGN